MISINYRYESTSKFSSFNKYNQSQINQCSCINSIARIEPRNKQLSTKSIIKHFEKNKAININELGRLNNLLNSMKKPTKVLTARYKTDRIAPAKFNQSKRRCVLSHFETYDADGPSRTCKKLTNSYLPKSYKNVKKYIKYCDRGYYNIIIAFQSIKRWLWQIVFDALL